MDDDPNMLETLPRSEAKMVPLIEVPFRSIAASDTPLIRVKHAEALDYELLMRSLEPQLVVKLPAVNEGEIGVYNVLSGYTADGLHVMELDTTHAYRPTPAEIPDSEGAKMMQTAGKIIHFMRTYMPEMTRINFGYNSSPFNYGPEEEKAGLQSITTKFHPQIWNTHLEDASQVALNQLLKDPTNENNRNAARFIEGESFNRLAGEQIRTVIEGLNSSFVDFGTMQIDKQGFHGKLSLNIEMALNDPNFFAGFIKPLHQALQKTEEDIFAALTDVDFGNLRRMIKNDFELGVNGIYPDLQADPKLKPLPERVQGIESLQDAGYPQRLVEALRILNPFLKDRDQVGRDQAGVEKWFRKGLGYALLITQGQDEPVASIHIRPAIRIVTSRGGVAETGNISLTRQLKVDQKSAQRVEKNKENIQKLQEFLTK